MDFISGLLPALLSLSCTASLLYTVLCTESMCRTWAVYCTLIRWRDSCERECCTTVWLRYKLNGTVAGIQPKWKYVAYELIFSCCFSISIVCAVYIYDIYSPVLPCSFITNSSHACGFGISERYGFSFHLHTTHTSIYSYWPLIYFYYDQEKTKK